VLGIDTPESKAGGGKGGAKCLKEQRLGIIAKAYAKKLLTGTTVTIEPNPRQDDPYGRLLGTVRLADGRSYGDIMISTGNAKPYDPAKAGNFKKPDWCK
jgi:endonuclease YncB( thermonuclease family)